MACRLPLYAEAGSPVPRLRVVLGQRELRLRPVSVCLPVRPVGVGARTSARPMVRAGAVGSCTSASA